MADLLSALSNFHGSTIDSMYGKGGQADQGAAGQLGTGNTGTGAPANLLAVLKKLIEQIVKQKAVGGPGPGLGLGNMAGNSSTGMNFPAGWSGSGGALY